MPTETNVLNLLLDLGIVAKIVIFILLVFSTASWATIAERWRYFRRAQDQSRRFLNLFRTQND
ncbi:MAG TPA: Tol-Pal system subunit TolQ, partial [Candidatus Latescibacteria bacterium]|nr:Tol-Pal system subunit TolQ [Candidatus Latescibacterota bacterium]